jgi:hydrogenase expression/formation protein HypC
VCGGLNGVLSVPGRIVEIIDEERRLARVEVEGKIEQVHFGPVERVTPGEWVLVYLGLAVSKLEEREALETLQFIRDLARASEEGR